MMASPESLARTALDPAFAPVDSQHARDRLAFAARFARLVRFHPLEYAADHGLSRREWSDWQPFLLKDPAVLLAYIAATDYRGLHAEFDTLRHASGIDKEASLALAPALLRLLRDLFSTLGHWSNWLDRQDPGFPLRAFLSRRVEEQLAGALARMRELHAALARQGLTDTPDLIWYRSFDANWQVRIADPVGRSDEDAPALLDRAVEMLRQCYLDTLDVMVQTIDAAAHQYEVVARQATPHPDTALLRVFVDLMHHQQEALNRIGRRHLDFYYRRVLEIEPRKAIADRVVVFTGVAAGQSSVDIPAGTRFAAGKSQDGAPLWYANAESAAVNTARIAAAYCLKAQVGSPMHGFQTGIHVTQLADVEQLQHDAAGHVLDQAVFGAPVVSPQGLAFGLASPMMLLEGGHRHLTIVCELDTMQVPLPDDWTRGWRCWMTSASGWFDASVYALPPHLEVAGDGQPALLTLEWILPPDTPAIVPLSGPHRDPLTSWPQLRCCLPPGISTFPWPRMMAVRFDVSVRGLRSMSLYNDLVPLTAIPAAPFGPVPQVGHRCWIGSREVFAKPLEKLILRLVWANLPASFSDWYREYNAWQAAERPDWPAFDDNIHSVDWQSLEKGSWRPIAPSVPIGCSTRALFQRGGLSLFAFSFDADHIPCPDLVREPLAVPAQARDGYLTMTLAGPAQAFGHAQYPQVLMWAGQRMAMPSSPAAPGAQAGAQVGPSVAVGVPNPPVSPQVHEITLEYLSSARIEITIGTGDPATTCPMQWFHEGPWGRWMAWDNTQAGQVSAPLAPGLSATGLTLLPAVATESCLLLAIDAAPLPATLRMYAAITDDGAGRGFDAWQYGAKGWRALEIWRDDSAGFSSSGLIELSLHPDRVPLPSLPDSDMLCVAITPVDGWRDLRVSLLGTQAVVLERQDLAPTSPVRPTLAPGVITKSPLPALGAIRQPLHSWGGRAAEHQTGFDDEDSFYRRVSRRLLHKGRALTSRDLVLLAHEIQPDLHRVEVMPLVAGERGCVRLGVVPRIRGADVPGAWRPSVSPAAREHLASSLQALGSAQSLVQVDNLRQRAIKITASLLLTREAQAAWPALRQAWNQALRLYLSPWIQTTMPQYDAQHGLGRADLLRSLAGFPGVLTVIGLHVAIGEDGSEPVPSDEDVLIAPPGVIWVSASQHTLTLAEG